MVSLSSYYSGWLEFEDPLRRQTEEAIEKLGWIQEKDSL